MKQKKRLINVLITLFIVATTAQISNAQYFNVGDKDLSFGIGFGNVYNSLLGSQMGIPAISISGDYGISDEYGPGVIGIGAIFGFNSSKDNYSFFYDYSIKYTSIFAGARGSYHMEFVDNLDTYGIFGLYMLANRYKYGGDYGLAGYDASGTNLYLKTEFVAGAKYYFSDNLAAFGELGFGYSLIRLGLSVKLE